VAMHYGLPVVATSVGGLVEAVAGYGGAVLTEPANAAALVAALRRAAAMRGQRFGTILARTRAGWGWFGFPYVMPPVLSRPCHRQFLDGIGNRAQHASARGETDIAKLARPAGRFRLQHGADEEASDKLPVSSDG
jgi:hypothetical protein